MKPRLQESFLEPLESRQLLAADIAGLTPAQVRKAYGFDQVQFSQVVGHGRHGKAKHATAVSADGSGQTIAIVDAFHAPTVQQDLSVFDQQFGLPDTDAKGKPVLTVAMPQGKPSVDAGWASEIALDVEWAHAIAPKAHILLVEAASDSTDDLITAINYARKQKGVVAVSMSWGGDESPFQHGDDPVLTTPKNHIGGSGRKGGITFVTSAGDGAGFAAWPASSPNAVTVGGTTLSLDANGNWQDEVAWVGSGGGVSDIESTSSPDVAYNANPDTGFAVYDSTPDEDGSVGWSVVAGTSAGAPQWAALIAIADQGRALRGLGSLDGMSQLKPVLYSVPQDHFHDITVGSNGHPALPGYDLVTGRGSPKADKLIWDFVNA
jgi:subtilase family serine protease